MVSIFKQRNNFWSETDCTLNTVLHRRNLHRFNYVRGILHPAIIICCQRYSKILVATKLRKIVNREKPWHLADNPRLGLLTTEKTAAQWGKCRNCDGHCVERLVTDWMAVVCEVCLLDPTMKKPKQKGEVNGNLKSSKDRDPAVGT